MKLILTAFLFSAVCMCVSTAFGQTKTADKVVEALKEYDETWKKKDVAGVAKFLADDYVYFSSTGGTSDRKRTLEFLASPDYKLTFFERSEIVVHSGGPTVVVSSRWKGRGTWKNGEINDDQRCGQVFIKEKKAWKMLTEHCAQIVSN